MAKKEKDENLQDAQDAKMKMLALAMEKLDKEYGKGTVMKLSDTKVVDVQVISTGSLGLDLALGVGGIQRQGYRNLRTGIFGQNYLGHALYRRSTKGRRHCRFY